LIGTQGPSCAETAGSTPAVIRDLDTTWITNTTAPTKRPRPPIRKSCEFVTVS
jgi:hypothetical protein